MVGKPLYTDNFIVELDSISYAQVLVETNISHLVHESIRIDTSFGIIHQHILYGW